MVAGAAMLAALSACDLPFGLGTPTERALESGAAGSLSAATSFEIIGTYTGPGVSLPARASGARTSPPPSSAAWSIDLQITRPDREHVLASGSNVKVEALVFGQVAYFRGQQFLSDHMGTDPLSRDLVSAAGNAWWKGPAGLAPQLPDFTTGSAFTSTFLGAAVTQRTDNVSVDGIDAVDLSGPRADVFIASAPPYQLLLVQLKRGVAIDGIGDAQLRFTNFNHDFGLKPPTDVIDFSNLSTLPPIYTVLSVDTTRCASPCVVSAVLKNLGGMSAARGPSTITFTMTDAASGTVIGSCKAQVNPDVGYNANTTVSCTIGSVNGPPANAAIVTATPDNPGRA